MGLEVMVAPEQGSEDLKCDAEVGLYLVEWLDPRYK